MSNYPGTSTAFISSKDFNAWKTPIHNTGKILNNGLVQYNEMVSDASLFSKMNPVKNPNYLSDNKDDFVKTKMAGINPGYGTVPGTTNNCSKCSASLTLMKMGYNNVQAGRADHPMDAYASSYWFEGGTHKKTNDLNDIKNALENAPNGSFGMMGMGRADSDGERLSGHEFSWTKTRSGKIRIEDPQDGKVYDSLDEYISKQGFSSGTLATFDDLTNAKPNWKAMEMDGVFGIRNNDLVGKTNVTSVSPLNTNNFHWDNAEAYTTRRFNDLNTRLDSISSSVFNDFDDILDELDRF